MGGSGCAGGCGQAPPVRTRRRILRARAAGIRHVSTCADIEGLSENITYMGEDGIAKRLAVARRDLASDYAAENIRPNTDLNTGADTVKAARDEAFMAKALIKAVDAVECLRG